MKENEEILRDEINVLKTQVHNITIYLEAQKRILEDYMSSSDIGAYRQDFWSQQQVLLGGVSQNQSINVYAEFAPGSYKQVQPVISECGGSTQLDFDMPYTGYVIIGSMGTSGVVSLPCTPLVIPNDGIALLIEPEIVEPIIRTGIHDTWQR